MKPFIDVHSIANTVRMSRALRKHSCALLVEGYKDVRVFRNLVCESACDVFPTEGKANALGALNLLRRSNQRGVLVIIDADFTDLNGQQVIDSDVIATDVHDLEAMLLKSPAPERVMTEYDLAIDSFGTDIGEMLAHAAKPIGYLRLASVRSNLRLKFTDLVFPRFTEINPALRVDERKLAHEVVRNSPACRHDVRSLLHLMASVANVSSTSDDHWRISCGHDMAALFAMLLGQKVGRDVPAYTVERQLRLSYHASYFAGTRLFASIRAWEQRNAPYIVLR